MSNWVSVEQQLPDARRVIVRFMKNILGVPTPHYEMGYFVEPNDKEKLLGWLYWRDNKPIHWPVTHWMIPPDGPEEEAQ